jgi:hypothetical protein
LAGVADASLRATSFLSRQGEAGRGKKIRLEKTIMIKDEMETDVWVKNVNGRRRSDWD